MTHLNVPPTDRLDEIRARADMATALTLGDDNARDCYNIVADDVPELVAALRAVLDLHQPRDGYGTTVCAACSDDPYEDSGCMFMPYPCPTVKVITAALVEARP